MEKVHCNPPSKEQNREQGTIRENLFSLNIGNVQAGFPIIMKTVYCKNFQSRSLATACSSGGSKSDTIATENMSSYMRQHFWGAGVYYHVCTVKSKVETHVSISKIKLLQGYCQTDKLQVRLLTHLIETCYQTS